jgi:hypothetical protein
MNYVWCTRIISDFLFDHCEMEMAIWLRRLRWEVVSSVRSAIYKRL